MRTSFAELDIEVEFSGKDEHEKGVIIEVDEERITHFGLNMDDLKLGQTVVKVDEKYFRQAEVDLLLGDPTKFKTQLGWQLKYDLPAFVKEAMLVDLDFMKNDEHLRQRDYFTLNCFE